MRLGTSQSKAISIILIGFDYRALKKQFNGTRVARFEKILAGWKDIQKGSNFVPWLVEEVAFFEKPIAENIAVTVTNPSASHNAVGSTQ